MYIHHAILHILDKDAGNLFLSQEAMDLSSPLIRTYLDKLLTKVQKAEPKRAKLEADNEPVGRFQQVQTHRLQMALRTHFTQTKIGCPGVAEFTVQRTEALFDHITSLRQISVAFGLRFRQRTVAAGFAHNAV